VITCRGNPLYSHPTPGVPRAQTSAKINKKIPDFEETSSNWPLQSCKTPKKMHCVLNLVIIFQKQVINCRGNPLYGHPRGSTSPKHPQICKNTLFWRNPTEFTTLKVIRNIQKNALGIVYSYYSSQISDNLHGVTPYMVTIGFHEPKPVPKLAKNTQGWRNTTNL